MERPSVLVHPAQSLLVDLGQKIGRGHRDVGRQLAGLNLALRGVACHELVVVKWLLLHPDHFLPAARDEAPDVLLAERRVATRGYG